MNAVEIDQVSFAYAGAKQPALRDVTLAIGNDQIVGIVGRAGAGKSTFCALCAGFVPSFYHGPFRGAVRVDGRDAIAEDAGALARHVGLVGSNAFSQISGARFSVFEEVAFGLENLGFPREEMAERVEYALGVLNIAHLRDRSPYQLSGGQQQRVVIASAIALRPPVLILDEPTAQLDPPSIAQLADTLRDLARQGTTVIFAEHRLEWAAALAERVIVLDEGEVVADGPPQAIFTDPRLRTLGIGWPRPALLAEQARQHGHWPAERPLPVTLDALQAGLPPRDTPAPHAPRPPLPGSPLVRLEQVRYAYPGGVEALKGVSFAVRGGERVALLGRNGAGKSTLVRHLNGLLKPSRGDAFVGDSNTRKQSVARSARQVGIAFQDVRNQIFARTVRDELRFGPKNLGCSAARIEALVDMALERLHLREVANEHPYDLPLAGRRLVAIAAVLAMDVPLLVLDEPTAGLDTQSVERLTALCHDYAAQGRSVLVVTHDLDFCYEALDRVVLMRDGQITLDSAWDSLSKDERATLEETVGLPIALNI